MQNKNRGYLVLFSCGLLFFSVMIRSGVIVDKSFLPRFLGLALLLLITVLAGLRNAPALKANFIEFFFILYWLWNLVSCSWAISLSEALMQSQLVFISLAVFLVISAIARKYSEFEGIFTKTFLFVLLFSFGLAFLKMASLEHYDPYKIISVSANNNLYSGFLLLSLPLAVAGYSTFRGWWKWLSVAAGILALFFIIIVQSRAVYLGLFFATILSAGFILSRYRRVINRRNISTGIISLCLLLSGVLLFYSSLDATRKNYFLSKIPVWHYFRSYDKASLEELERIRNAHRSDLTQMPEFDFSEDYHENANLRLIFWKKSLCLIKSSPMTGVGAGNWRIGVPSCKYPINPEHTLKNYTYSQPHNEWIGILSELGITGFILSLFVFVIPLMIVFYRLARPGPEKPVSALIYSCFIAGFYLFAVFDFPFKRVEHIVLLFTILAFLYREVPVGFKSFRFMEKIPQGWFSLSLIVLLSFTVFLAAERTRGEYYTLKMFRNERKNDPNEIVYCRMAGNPFYRITPNTLPVAWFEGVAEYRSGNAAAALDCFRRALQSTPYEVRVLNDYATALYASHNTGQAKSVLLHALDIDPCFDDAKFNLGAIYYFTGKKDSAFYFVSDCRESQKKKDFLEELK
jgi:O-antigen ligase